MNLPRPDRTAGSSISFLTSKSESRCRSCRHGEVSWQNVKFQKHTNMSDIPGKSRRNQKGNVRINSRTHKIGENRNSLFPEGCSTTPLLFVKPKLIVKPSKRYTTISPRLTSTIKSLCRCTQTSLYRCTTPAVNQNAVKTQPLRRARQAERNCTSIVPPERRSVSVCLQIVFGSFGTKHDRRQREQCKWDLVTLFQRTMPVRCPVKRAGDTPPAPDAALQRDGKVATKQYVKNN